MNDWEFCQSLKKRGLSQTSLARLAGVGRCHLSQVLSNVPGRGGHTRRKLFPHLTAEEVLMLGWAGEYEAWLKKMPRQRRLNWNKVLHGTMFQFRQKVGVAA